MVSEPTQNASQGYYARPPHISGRNIHQIPKANAKNINASNREVETKTMTTFKKITMKLLMHPLAANDNSAEDSAEDFVIHAMCELDYYEARMDALLFALQAVRRWN